MRNRTCDRPGLRRRILLGALAVGFLLAPAPARAEVAVGAEAPDVEAKEFINVEPISLSQLSGRLILLELFTTT